VHLRRRGKRNECGERSRYQPMALGNHSAICG
jgi:hypothetical protein